MFTSMNKLPLFSSVILYVTNEIWDTRNQKLKKTNN